MIMSKPAEATCESAFGAGNPAMPSSDSDSRPQAVDLRLAIPLLAKPYRVTVLAEPLRLPAGSLCRDGDRHSLFDKVHLSSQFIGAFIVGGFCWLGVESLAVKVLHLI
ncbi:MAG: hypothetical protein GWN87_28175, partial [Desulfuromonadales bacterium]|nr:hypothetical protein [Desulfuromonadales bacterium]NIS43554.1 hypothetical protein [Desulfuromonadales bacterium]